MKNSDKFHLMIVGDVHGHYEDYLETIRLANYSLQLGDLGFDYTPLIRSGEWDPEKHKFLPGNHDNYTIKEVHGLDPRSAQVLDPYSNYVVLNGKVYLYTHLPKNFVGNYGIWRVPTTEPEVDQDFLFFVRGAWSIDFANRTLGVDLWENEELTEEELKRAVKMYEEVKPSIVISHTCPHSVKEHLQIYGTRVKTRTSAYLQQMFDIHQPKLWVFGHHHQEFDKVIGGCRFVCLQELAFLCLDEHLEPLPFQ